MSYATAPVTDEKLEAFIAGAQGVINAYFEKSYKNLTPPTLVAEKGRKYIRIVSTETCSRSAWAFVEASTGLILKSASWKVPAKHARGTIHTETHGAEYVGPYGPAYLR